MFKKNLALCMAITLALLLSGCGGAKQTEAKIEDNVHPSTSDNENKTNINNEKLTEKPNSDSKSGTTKTEATKPEANTNSESDSKTKSNSTSESLNPIVLSDPSSLSTKPIEWSWMYSSRDDASLLSKYKGYGFGDTSKKIIYLTFDEGYENGYTASILDTLKANNVPATFFVTKPFVTGNFNGVSNTELIKRMNREGHTIGNHSVQHKSMATFKNEADFDAELTGVADAVNSIPNCKMSNYFRPPEGTFSELSLYYTQKLGYKSIFFALAYQDFNVDNQPDPESSKATLLKNTRNGMICLLHAVSKTNNTILDSLIKEWKSQGYEFKTLDSIPN